MSENAEDNDPPPAASRGKPARCGRKKISATADVDLDQVYRKMSQREHVLARPESYLGSTDPLREIMWIYDAGEHSFTLKEVSYVPALYKLYDEIIMNAIDNSRRDPTMNTIKVEINKDKNELSVLNNGQGLRVVKRKKEDMYLPSFLFGELLTSSNFDDKEKKLTGGRNGYGAKLCNIFSSKFSVETFSTTDKKFFKQDWSNNMSETTTPVVKRRLKGEDYTKVTFSPDLSRFKMEELDPDTVALLSRRAFDIAGCVEGIKVHLNGYQLPVDNFVDYVQLFVRGEPDEPGKHRRIVYERVNERWELAVMPSESGDFQQISFVNGVCTKKGGTHVDHVVDRLVKEVCFSFTPPLSWVELIKRPRDGSAIEQQFFDWREHSRAYFSRHSV